MRTLRRVRVQAWVNDAWQDVTDSGGTPNPVVEWLLPTAADGSQVRSFSFAALSTTKVRVTVEDGSTDGHSFLDEIEAYGS